jgi:hypothetical protein
LCHTHETLQSPCDMTRPPMIFTSTGEFVGSYGEGHMMTVSRESRARYVGKRTLYIVLTRLINSAARRHGILYYDYSRFRKHVSQNKAGVISYPSHGDIQWSMYGPGLLVSPKTFICSRFEGSLCLRQSRMAVTALGSRIYAALRSTTLHGTC